MNMTEQDERTVLQLARMADCADPDSPESPGAAFLANVESSVADYDNPDEDTAHEIAGACVPVYTYEIWQTFVDLAAWQEDVAGEFGEVEDMTKGAQAALYMIGRRLAEALIEERAEQQDDEDES